MSNVSDIRNTMERLSTSFARVFSATFGSQHLAVRGTDAYQFQVDFCYIMNELKRGPDALRQSYISEANELISKMKNYKNNETENGGT